MDGATGRSVTVRLEPLGVDLVVGSEETLMHAAERHGYHWPTLCHGQAQCTVCFIAVDHHPDAFDTPGPRELEGLKLFAGRTFYENRTLRLACQARPVAETVVTKRGVRRGQS
jgi:2Fe-2S ferredoxin